MSMQHFLIPFCAFFCLCRVAAQTSIGFETGFGGRWAADNTLGATVRSTEDFYESSIKARSLGQGSLFGIQISHALNSAFALELGISYFYGTPQRRHLYTPSLLPRSAVAPPFSNSPLLSNGRWQARSIFNTFVGLGVA